MGLIYLEFSRVLADKDLVDLTDNRNPAPPATTPFFALAKSIALVELHAAAHLHDTPVCFTSRIGDDVVANPVEIFSTRSLNGPFF